LFAEAERVFAVPEADKETLEAAFSPQERHYINEQGIETFCALLRGLEAKSNVKSLDDDVTLWQLNWVEVAWPSGPTLCTNNGERLWFKTVLRDVTGTKKDVWMGEQAALELAGFEHKDAFMKAWSDGDPTFPIMASVKVVRYIREQDSGGASQPTQSQADLGYSMKIVHASEQPYHEAPTQATVNLVNLLRDTENDTSSNIPAALHMLQESACYAFTVSCSMQGMNMLIPCQKVVALVMATEKSKAEQVNDRGFKVTTSNVKCMLATDAAVADQTYTLCTLCTVDSLPQYRLDPVRGKCQPALVTISGKIDEAFIVEQVQLLAPDIADKAKASLRTLLLVAMHLHSRDKKRQVIWNEQSSPGSAKKCRTLGRSATDAEVTPPKKQ
jgi:hypothetical protein